MVAAGVGVYKGNVGWAGAARALAFTLGVTGILVSAADGFMQGFRQRDTFEFEFSVRNVTEGVIAGAMLLLGDALSKMIKRRTEELAGAPREAPPADAPWR
jgi:hypothetical protein